MFTSIRNLLIAAVPIAFFFSACSTNGSGESLTLPGSFPIIAPGDTTDVVAAVKKARDATGRIQTNSSYTDFYLVSNDTTIARIVQQRRVLGVAKGSTTVMAKDNASSLTSPAYALQVDCAIACATATAK